MTVTLDGEKIVLPDLGLRRKGNAGSYPGLDEKSALLLNFDRHARPHLVLGTMMKRSGVWFRNLDRDGKFDQATSTQNDKGART